MPAAPILAWLLSLPGPGRADPWERAAIDHQWPFGARGAPAGEPGRVVLTFDDGPSHQTTPALLDVLDRFGARAVFFVVPRRFAGDSDSARRNLEALREIRRRGHAIGNHTFSHARLSDLPPARQRRQMEQAERAIERATGQRPTLFRPPYGRSTGASLAYGRRRGWKRMLWDIDSQDHLLRDADLIYRRLLSETRARGGGVVLLHDTHAWSVRAAELWLDALRRESCDRIAAGGPPWRVAGPPGQDGRPLWDDPIATPEACGARDRGAGAVSALP